MMTIIITSTLLAWIIGNFIWYRKLERVTNKRNHLLKEIEEEKAEEKVYSQVISERSKGGK